MKRSTFSRLCLATVITAGLAPSFGLAQPPGGRGPGGFDGPFGGGGLIGLAMREEVQQEIQLVDEQLEKVQAVAQEARDKMRAEMRTMFDQMRDLSDEERRARFGEIREKMEAMNAEVEQQLNKALLPHQIARLKQIDLQMRMQQRGEGGLSSRALADALELSDEQREKLEQRAEEVRAELQEKIRQAQTEAREKLLEVLTPAQKAKLQELTGEPFQISDEGRFFGRGGFRSRGGRDGERGARGSDRETERRNGEDAI